MSWRYSLKLMFLLCISSSVFSQDPYPILRHFDARDGLPSSEIYDIIQDRQGYIWISTDNGVSRFNGYQFENFGPEQGLSDPVVFHLFEDHRGWIWMYTFREQVFIYRDGIISEFPYTELLKQFKPRQSPRLLEWFYVDQQGNFFGSLHEGSIVRIDTTGQYTDITADIPAGYIIWHHEGYQFFSYKRYPPEEELEGFAPIYRVPIKEAVALTIVQPDGSKTIVNKPWYRYFNSNSSNKFFQKNSYRRLPARDRILMQFDDRIELIEVSTGETVQHIPYNQGTILTQLECEMSSLVFQGHNYAERGLSIHDRNGFRQNLDNLQHPRLKVLLDHTIPNLLEDRQGGLWIPTIENGVYYMINPSFLLNYIDDPSIEVPKSIAYGVGDTLFIMTNTHQAYTATGPNTVQAIPQEPHNRNGFHIHYDSINRRVITDGLVKYWDQSNKGWFFFLEDGVSAEPADLGDHFQGRQFNESNRQSNHFWFFQDISFYRADFSEEPHSRSPQYYLTPRQRLFSILETSKGQVFIGGMEGLYQLDEDGTSKPITHHPALQNRIEDIVEMPNEALILGTKGGGILIWHADTTLQISAAQGLTSSSIEQIHVDERQQIWVGTNKGLNRIHLNEDWSFTVESITYADGLPSNEITDITSKGLQLSVATVRGILSFPIDKQFSNGPVAPVIEQVRVNGINYDLDELNELKWYQDNITIAVTSLDFTQAGKITYRYRLTEDENDQWQRTQSPLIEIARLSSGSYQFELQALGRNGEWSQTVTFPLHLQKAFWTSAWFWTGIVSLIFIAFSFYYNRELRRKARQQEQDRQMLQLESEINDLRQQAYRAQMNPHFVYNCLTAIQSFMLSNDQDQLMASDYLSKFALLTRQALDASRQKSISLANDIKMLENYVQLEQFRFGQRFTYSFEIDNSLPIHDIDIPAMLVQPYVENAILHGLSGLDYQGKLVIEYQLEDDLLAVSIHDNGQGIFSHQAKKSNYQPNIKHRSAGMDIARKRIEGSVLAQSGGAVIIEEIKQAQQIKGTIVKVKIPLD
ncbi:MAG: histidine kinase [Bacteroidota bacterium]